VAETGVDPEAHGSAGVPRLKPHPNEVPPFGVLPGTVVQCGTPQGTAQGTPMRCAAVVRLSAGGSGRWVAAISSSLVEAFSLQALLPNGSGEDTMESQRERYCHWQEYSIAFISIDQTTAWSP